MSRNAETPAPFRRPRGGVTAEPNHSARVVKRSLGPQLTMLLNLLLDASDVPDAQLRSRLLATRNIVAALTVGLSDPGDASDRMFDGAERAAVVYLDRHPDEHARELLIPADYSDLATARLTRAKKEFLEQVASAVGGPGGPARTRRASSRNKVRLTKPQLDRIIQSARRAPGKQYRSQEDKDAREAAERIALAVRFNEGIQRHLRIPSDSDLAVLEAVVRNFVKNERCWPLEVAKAAAYTLGVDWSKLKHFFGPDVIRAAGIATPDRAVRGRGPRSGRKGPPLPAVRRSKR